MLFSPHEIANYEEQKKVMETVKEEVENDAVWSQFKRKAAATEQRETYVLLAKEKAHLDTISLADLQPR